MTSLRLPEATEARLAHLAALTRRTKSFFIKEALDRHLDDLEDAYIALERIAQPNRKFLTTDQVLARIEGVQ